MNNVQNVLFLASIYDIQYNVISTWHNRDIHCKNYSSNVEN